MEVAAYDSYAILRPTTDGSALYPEPLREVFGKVRHQP